MADAALAVDLQLAGPNANRVRDWIESVLGWQPVDGRDGGLAPSLALTDAAAETRSSLPTIVLVDEGDDPVLVAGRVVMTGATAVLAWPAERDELPAAADRAMGDRASEPAGQPLRIGGAAGGVGTTTVALALGGLAAWSGVRTLVLGRGQVPVRGVTSISANAMGAHGIWSHATAVPGVRELRALAIEGAGGAWPPDHEAGLVVLDAGVDPDVDVLVGRRDAATMHALGETCASVLALTDTGPASATGISEELGRRRLVVLPHSHRVAAAGLAGRVPSALPGRWLAALRPVVAGLAFDRRN